MINRNIFHGLACILSAAVSVALPGCGMNPEYHVKVSASGEGWGYDILHGDKIIIHQPYIPALNGNHPFPSRAAAVITGQAVARKLENRIPPRLSSGEVDSLIRSAD